jgi:hypothetical protein
MALGRWGGRIRTPGGPSRSTRNPSGSEGRRGATLFSRAPAGHRCGAFYGKSLLDPDGVAGCSSRCGWSYSLGFSVNNGLKAYFCLEILLFFYYKHFNDGWRSTCLRVSPFLGLPCFGLICMIHIEF